MGVFPEYLGSCRDLSPSGCFFIFISIFKKLEICLFYNVFIPKSSKQVNNKVPLPQHTLVKHNICCNMFLSLLSAYQGVLMCLLEQMGKAVSSWERCNARAPKDTKVRMVIVTDACHKGTLCWHPTVVCCSSIPYAPVSVCPTCIGSRTLPVDASSLPPNWVIKLSCGVSYCYNCSLQAFLHRSCQAPNPRLCGDKLLQQVAALVLFL